MAVGIAYEMSVPPARRHFPKDCNAHFNRREKLAYQLLILTISALFHA
jgi:hypothetical protein